MKQRTRPTAIEMHPNRSLIEQELAEGLPIRTLSEKYKISRQALVGYRNHRLPERVVRAVERKDITNAEELFKIILKTVQRMEKLSDSCDDYIFAFTLLIVSV